MDNNTDAADHREQLTTLENIAISEKLPRPLNPSEMPCPKCGKVFGSKNALQMHDMRVHSKKLGDGFRWKGKGVAVPVLTREQRLVKRRAYNRKWRMERGIKPRPSSYRGGNKGMKLSKWTPERRRKFIATMKAKNQSKPIELKPKAVTPVLQSVNFCPRCGCNVEVVRKAIEFADRV